MLLFEGATVNRQLCFSYKNKLSLVTLTPLYLLIALNTISTLNNLSTLTPLNTLATLTSLAGMITVNSDHFDLLDYYNN